MNSRDGASRERWWPERGPPVLLEGTHAVRPDGTVTIDVGDGVMRRFGEVIAEYFETRRDALGDRRA